MRENHPLSWGHGVMGCEGEILHIHPSKHTKTMEHHHFFMGNLTISMAIFNRVYPLIMPQVGTSWFVSEKQGQTGLIR